MSNFRLKFQTGERSKISLQDYATASIENLASQVAQACSIPLNTIVGFSLNGKDVFAPSSTDLVSQHFRPGDLIHVRLADGQAPLTLPDPAPSAPQPVPSTPAPAPSSLQAPPSVTHTTHAAPASAPPQPSTTLPVPSAVLPASLQSLLSCPSPPQGDQERLMALLHATFLETGFLPSAPVPSIGSLRQSASRFECRYALQRNGPGSPVMEGGNNAPTCTLRVSFLGTHVVAAACSDAKPQAEVFRVTLTLTDHVDPATVTWTRPAPSLILLKDSLCRPLFSAMLADLGIEFEASLLALPFDLRSVVLGLLDARSLVMLGASCREMRLSCSEDSLWVELFKKEFPATVSSPSVQADARRRGWHAVYADKMREKQEMEQRRREAAGRNLRVPPPLLPPFGAPHILGGPRPPFPGVIGGDYDLLPGGGFGMGGGVPLGPGGLPQGFGFNGGRGSMGPGLGGPGFTSGPFGMGGMRPRGGPGTGGGNNWI